MMSLTHETKVILGMCRPCVDLATPSPLGREEARRRLGGEEAPLTLRWWGREEGGGEGGLKTEPLFRLDQTPGLITQLPHGPKVLRNVLHTHTHTQ